MYQKRENQLLLPHEFFLPFTGKLNEENRWVKLAQFIPWDLVEKHYAQLFKPKSKGGQMAVSVRVALGSLVIQERLGSSDRDTVENITENPYLQYFIGLPGFQQSPPFDASLMTHFRKRLGADVLNQVNEWIIMAAKADEESDDDDHTHSDDGGQDTSTQTEQPKVEPDVPRQGKLLLDATCAPADIAYPTDLSLLNGAREKLEQLIDVLHAPHAGRERKPRTYRQKARRAYLVIAKQRRTSKQKIRRAIGQQLRYVMRDLKAIEHLATRTPLTKLSRQQYKNLLVIQELFRQQKMMHDTRSHRIDDRIVSISQPHVRPIVRGKAKANVEFGAKVAVSMVDGYARIDHVQWDTFNEGQLLQESVEAYRERYGCYPEAVLADKLYRNRANLQYCRDRGIRLSGPRLGRPAKAEEAAHKQVERQDSAERNAIEGKFGETKRRYGLDRIRARLAETSLTVISLRMLVMNLERWLRVLFAFCLQLLGSLFLCSSFAAFSV
ncbi:IS5 family transposase [Alicyclobacillus sp. ALC3]|uniref:IS5 family transposase n=1 Tax=Alicyclobacillus sp. ALC3 TaxID=2796143 RepID=UPI002377F21E|nr:IS5 family transposase [Alicyclobacillus sp. ALC3]WDL97896.1 IS5 family transposase [Alicyclobacillus sp. ALC3]